MTDYESPRASSMEEDRAANQRSALSLSFTLALYISNGFGLRFLLQLQELKLISEKKFERNQKPILRFPRFLNFMEATKVTCSSLSMLNELKFTGIDIFIILSTNLSANFIAC